MTHVPWHPEPTGDEAEVHGFESVELTSVGIDIGTTTTHLMLSRLVARRQGGDHSSAFEITDREVSYQSPITLTPYADERTVDADAIDEFLTEAYADAGIEAAEIDTGAVIVTGEAARKDNAAAIADLFSARAGEFVCATAGPNLEAMLAAHGSGATEYAFETGQTVLHLDIGGGTTKFALVDSGTVVETLSISVGARLVAVDGDGRVTLREDAGISVAEDAGIDLTVGEPLTTVERERFVDRLTTLLLEVSDGDPSALADSLLVTDPASLPRGDDAFESLADLVTVSGGVSEYVYGRGVADVGDLGPELGAAVRDALTGRSIELATLDPGIRATVMGSTQHSMQVSGNTISLTDQSELPLRNVPIVPFVTEADESVESFRSRLVDKLDQYDVDELAGGFALGFHVHGEPTAAYLDRIVDGAIGAYDAFGTADRLVLVFESDLALNAGANAADRVDRPVVAIDGIELHQFGYIDIGKPIAQTGSVPVTVKSLVFDG